MDDIFDASRPKLVDLFSALQKEESALQPLMAADHPDEKKIIRQIDRVLQAKTELERANARMLLDLRLQLTREQWTALQTQRGRASAPNATQDGGRDPANGKP